MEENQMQITLSGQEKGEWFFFRVSKFPRLCFKKSKKIAWRFSKKWYFNLYIREVVNFCKKVNFSAKVSYAAIRFVARCRFCLQSLAIAERLYALLKSMTSWVHKPGTGASPRTGNGPASRYRVRRPSWRTRLPLAWQLLSLYRAKEAIFLKIFKACRNEIEFSILRFILDRAL